MLRLYFSLSSTHFFIRHEAGTFHFLVPNCKVPLILAVAPRGHQQLPHDGVDMPPSPSESDEFAPTWLHLGLAGRWDEENFPSEETFTFLYSHVIKLQLLEGKAHREVQQRLRSYLKHGSQCLHGGTEQKGYQT